MTLLSVIIPVYNEEDTIETLVDKVVFAKLPSGLDSEIIIVDDASTDGTRRCAMMLAEFYPNIVRVLRRDENRGKGAAVRLGMEKANGAFLIIQDADNEYPPDNYCRLLEPLISRNADAVYGVRKLHGWHWVGNKMLTLLSNLASGLSLKDMETGHKAFRLPLLETIPLRSDRFGFEAEVTAKLAARKAVIYQTPIDYYPRTKEQGKKIGWRDALDTIWTIIKYSIFSDCYEGNTKIQRFLAKQ
jgi:glycosyltransferase involved in cell wall biosynthesis